jgi:hypothetical protein
VRGKKQVGPTSEEISSMGIAALEALAGEPGYECPRCFSQFSDTSPRTLVHKPSCPVVRAQNELEYRRQRELNEREKAQWEAQHGPGTWQQERIRRNQEESAREYEADCER